MSTSLSGVPAIGGGYRMGTSLQGEVNLLKVATTGLAAYTAAAAPMVAADLTGGFITYNAAGGNNLQLPKVVDLEAAVSNAASAGDAFDFSIAALGAGTATVTTNTGWTLVGSMAVAQNVSGRFRAVKTNSSGTSAWTLYRIS